MTKPNKQNVKRAREGNKTKSCGLLYEGGDGYYETNCKQAFFFDTGNREENNFKFCPFCGGEILDREAGVV